jgi:K+-transporting ATPase ATPase A chain
VAIGKPVESALLKLAGAKPETEMNWKQYALAVLLFSVMGVATVYAVQRLQLALPFNPQQFGNVSADSAFNTAISFVTNTNWQGYGGESTMSYLTQMVVLTVQNFVSAATAMAVVFALIRGFARHSTDTLGNFWVDMYRGIVYVLAPISVVIALIFVSQGVIQNTEAYQQVATVEAYTYDKPKLDAAGQPIKDEKGNAVTEPTTAQSQTIAMGPVASQEAIKMLGTNGGGFFNANSAHPFENPNALTNFVQMLAIFLIPAALCYAFGRLVGDTRQGWAVLGAMTAIFVVMTLVVLVAEQKGNPQFAALGIDQTASLTQAGGNMEGKEVRFGISASALFAAITTAASCGAVNAMHDSLTPIGGLVPLLNMQLGEVVFGGVGSGLYGMLVFAIMAVFVAGLMIGRTPEYLGKKIESFEMKMVSIAILITPLLILSGTAIAVMTEAGRAGISNPGAHGFSQVL